MPSLGRWLARQNPFFQWGLGAALKAIPFIAISWGFVILRFIYKLDWVAAATFPTLFGVVFYGAVLSWDYANKSDSANKLSVNLTIEWSPDKITDEAVTLKELQILKEDLMQKKFYYEGISENPLKDPLNGEEYSHLIFLCRYLSEKTFRRVPDQIVANRGSVFPGPASRLWVTWSDDYSNLGEFYEEDTIVGHRIFIVEMCPEDGGITQEELGIIPEKLSQSGELEKEPTPDENKKPGTKDITEASKLSDNKRALKIMKKLRDTEGKLRVYADTDEDSRMKAYENLNRLIEDEDKIRADKWKNVFEGRTAKILIIITVMAVIALMTKYLGYW
jgi:hypothetical protein